MPLYEYHCEACSRVFENYVRLAEENGEQTCPACGKPARKVGISLFSARSGPGASPGRSCGTGGRRSPFS